jgi:hypothetical protein
MFSRSRLPSTSTVTRFDSRRNTEQIEDAPPVRARERPPDVVVIRM